MNAKAYLQQYRAMMIKIRNLESQLIELEQMAEGISVNSDDERVQASGSKDRMAQLIVKIIDMKEDIAGRKAVAIDTMNEIADVIDSVKNDEYKRLLYARYINDMTWEQIAADMYYTTRWIYEMHGRALDEVQKILGNMETVHGSSG